MSLKRYPKLNVVDKFRAHPFELMNLKKMSFVGNIKYTFETHGVYAVFYILESNIQLPYYEMVY